MAGPVAIQIVVDRISTGKGLTNLLPITLAFAASILLEAISIRIAIRYATLFLQGFTAQLRARVLSHLLTLPTLFFDEARSGELVTCVIRNSEGLRSIIGTGLFTPVWGILEVVVGMGYLFYLNFGMAAVCGPLLFLSILPAVLSSKKTEPLFGAKNEMSAELMATASDQVVGVRTIKIFRSEKRETARFRAKADELAAAWIRITEVSSVTNIICFFLLGLCVVLALYLGVHKVVLGTLTLGSFAAFMLVFWWMLWPVFNLADFGFEFLDGISSLERVADLLDVPSERAKSSGYLDLPNPSGSIELVNVCFSYKENLVLHSVSFCASPGTVTAIVGPSGAGKSTIMSIIAGFYSPTTGKVLVDDLDLERIKIESYRKHVAYVQQETFLFSGTIRENLLFANPNATALELDFASAATGLTEFSRGLDLIVGEQGAKLSGGQRQRISIARALLANPRILLLDEATASLDSESESLILNRLADIKKNLTTIVVAHRLSTIQHADQILVLDKGLIVERGGHSSLLKAAGRYAQLYQYGVTPRGPMGG
jgi:ABC-type multidrug transport system fused ATPase/permease subunit